MSRVSDRALVERWRAGDRAAFEAVVDRYERRVYAACRSLLRDREEAADVAQEAFLQAFLSVDALRDPARLAGWLCGIALTLSRGRLRRTLRRQRLWERRPEPPPRSAEEVAFDDPLRGLSEEQRAALGLRFHAELGLKEVADALGLSVPAAKRLIYRALSTLRDAPRQGNLR